jgi:hypothetical protein
MRQQCINGDTRDSRLGLFSLLYDANAINDDLGTQVEYKAAEAGQIQGVYALAHVRSMK